LDLSVVSWGWGISWGSLVAWCWSLWVDSGSLISDISDISIITVGRVLDVLDSAIGKSNGVRSGNVAGTIGLLLGVEVRLGVVIGNSVGVGVGRNLIGVNLSLSVSWSWGMVSGSSNNWGMVSWGSNLHDWGWGISWGSVHGVGNNWGSVGNDWGVDGVNSMGDNSISTVKSVGGISNNSSVGTESLALCCASVFSLVWFANRLMADLSVSISIDGSVSSVVDWSDGAGDWGWEDWSVDGTVAHQTKIGTGGGQDGAQAKESLHVYLYVLS